MIPFIVHTNRNEVTPKPLAPVVVVEDTMQTKRIKSKNDNADALRYIDSVRDRGYDTMIWEAS